MFLRRRGAPFGPPYRVSHKCYAFPRRSCGVSTEKMRVSTEKLHICTEKRLSVTEQRQYSTEKFDFHGITTRLYGEGARFYGEGLALMGHRKFRYSWQENFSSFPQHFREKMFWCPFQYPKVPLEASAPPPPQSFDASYAPAQWFP